MLRDLRSAAEAGPDLRDWPATCRTPRRTAGSSSTSPHRSLRCRRDHPGLFTAGEYIPAEATGARGEHVFAFARRHGDRAVVAVPRL